MVEYWGLKDAKSFFFGFSSLIRTMEVEIVRTKITLARLPSKYYESSDVLNF